MEEPEPEARHCVVIARIAEIQKSEQVLIYEIKPEEAVILARYAPEREVEGWQCSQNYPRDGDRQHDD